MKFSSSFKKYPAIGGAVVIVAVLSIVYFQSSTNIESAQELFAKGNRYFSSASYDPAAAEQWYQRALRADGNLALVHYQLARLYFVQNRSDEALEHINAELAAHPDNFRSYYIRGLIDLYRKNYTAAVEDFNRFLSGKPQSWAALNDLTVAYLQAGNYVKAEEVSRQGLAYFPDNAWLRSNLGVALLNQKKTADARATLVVARDAFAKMSEEDWARAYPGNEGGLVAGGLAQARMTIEANIRAVENGGIDEQISGSHFISRVDGGIGYVIAACDESIGMSVAPLAIGRGQSATLSWITSNIEACSIDNGVGPVDPIGSVSVSPLDSTTYSLTCSSYATPHAHATTWTASAALTVQWLDIKENGSNGPLTLYMPNTDLTLDWVSGGGPYAGCSAFGDWSGSAYTGAGSQALGELTRGSANPGGGKSYNFGLNCGPSDSVTATVYQIPSCTISSDKVAVTPPEVVTLTWSCRYADAPSCAITDDQGGAPITVPVVNDATYRSGGTLRVRPTKRANYTFSLACNGLDGRTTVSTAPVTGGGQPKIHEVNP